MGRGRRAAAARCAAYGRYSPSPAELARIPRRIVLAGLSQRPADRPQRVAGGAQVADPLPLGQRQEPRVQLLVQGGQARCR